MTAMAARNKPKIKPALPTNIFTTKIKKIILPRKKVGPATTSGEIIANQDITVVASPAGATGLTATSGKFSADTALKKQLLAINHDKDQVMNSMSKTMQEFNLDMKFAHDRIGIDYEDQMLRTYKKELDIEMKNTVE